MSKLDKITSNRERFAKIKRLNFFKRKKCNHYYVYLGIDNQYKVFGCLKCGKERLDH